MNRNFSLSCILLLAAALPGLAQTRVVTADDYSRAEKFLGNGMGALVYNSGVRPTWLAGERFWYRNTTAEGAEFVLVDPAKGTRAPAFDHAKLAAALSSASGGKYDGAHLPFQTISLSADSQAVEFTVDGKAWKCDLAGATCTADSNPPATGGGVAGRGGRGGRGGGGGGGAPGRGGGGALSPDGKSSAFIKDNNLWMRDVASGKETQLTFDGEKDFGYATDNAGWTASNNAVVLWSPDSRKIATYQQDQRGVGEEYLVSTTVGHPTLQAWKYPLPGDKVITTIQRVVIDTTAPKVIRLQMPADQHRSTLCDDIKCGGTMDVQWNPEGTELMFVSTSRDHKVEDLRLADAATGAVRDVHKEVTKTFYESGNGRMNWHYLPATNEFIWFSEESNWGQLYLYDLSTGKLKNQITTGEGNVTQINRLDEKNRVIYFLGVGKQKGEDPYFVHLYSVGFDGKNQKVLNPDDGNHSIEWSPGNQYFVDTYSKPDVPPVSALRDVNGKLVTPLEKADISKLLASGWKPPQPITMKARDGVTDIYGLMFKPTNLDPTKKYPIINHIYPGPQTGSVGSRNFSVARGDCQALAELGFIVVEIDGMGTPWRSKKFHEAYFGDMGDNTLPDQVAGMRELAKKYPWIDIDKAGIYGHSGGGYATAGGMFHFPDFFKVGVSESGNHDNRDYEDDWAEKWMGLNESKVGSDSAYDNQANQNFAKNLKGHLLLAHGTMDNNVPPNNTLLVVSELIKANKDFDLIMFPNRPHGYGQDSNYMTRKRWDYFVRYLMGAEPPKEFEMRPATPAAPPGGGE